MSEADPYYPNDTCSIHAYPPETPTGRSGTWDDSKGLPNAAPWNWLATAVGLWYPPAAPDSFFNALIATVNILNGALQAAGHNTATVALMQNWGGVSPDLAAVQQFEQSRFDPANWTDAGTFLQNLRSTTLWQDQRDAMTILLQPATLPADAYYFLVHLLIALPTGNPADQHLAQRLVSASATSPEYPNDTFANQLVYLVLLYLADPLGPYGWPNAQLQAALHDLEGVILASDPASTAIKASLAQHGKVLIADAAYPMQDPYCPSVGFSRRKTDTLFALDKARHALQTAS
jgi:hypothetical protein